MLLKFLNILMNVYEWVLQYFHQISMKVLEHLQLLLAVALMQKENQRKIKFDLVFIVSKTLVKELPMSLLKNEKKEDDLSHLKIFSIELKIKILIKNLLKLLLNL